MTGSDAWLDRLIAAAPHLSRYWLGVLAHELADAPVEGLMIFRDVMREGGEDHGAGGCALIARELAAVADVIDREIDWRSPTLSLPRQA